MLTLCSSSLETTYLLSRESGPSELPEIIALASNLFCTPKDLEKIVSYSGPGPGCIKQLLSYQYTSISLKNVNSLLSFFCKKIEKKSIFGF